MDKGGNTYKTVKIGSQQRISENLNASTFRNGDIISEEKTYQEWNKAADEGKPAWCYYENDTENGLIYGKLYNWHAVNDARGLAPSGWHIPSDNEWDVLIKYLGGDQTAGTKMKSNNGWVIDPESHGEGNGTNESGFNVLPSGEINGYGSFGMVGTNTNFWTSTYIKDGFGDPAAKYYNLASFNGNVRKGHVSVNCGFPVRCIKD